MGLVCSDTGGLGKLIFLSLYQMRYCGKATNDKERLSSIEEDSLILIIYLISIKVALAKRFPYQII